MKEPRKRLICLMIKESSNVENRLRKFTLTVGGAAEKDECRTGKE